MGKSSTIKELKNRILDHFNSAGFQIGIDDLRIWLFTSHDSDKERQLQDAVNSVKEGFENGAEEVQDQDQDQED